MRNLIPQRLSNGIIQVARFSILLVSQFGQLPPCLPQHVEHEEDAEDHLSREDEVAVRPVPQDLLHVPDGAPQVGVE